MVPWQRVGRVCWSTGSIQWRHSAAGHHSSDDQHWPLSDELTTLYTDQCFSQLFHWPCAIGVNGRTDSWTGYPKTSSQVKWYWKRRQFLHCMTPVKIRGGLGEISGPNFEALPTRLRPNLQNTFDGHPLRGCLARCIDKKRKERKFMGKA